MSESDTLKHKLEQAKASAQRPLRVTDAELAVIMLRESFIAAQASPPSPCALARAVDCGCSDAPLQPVLSAAVGQLFKSVFPAAPVAAGADPEWFERLKSFAGNSVRNFMKIGGPWDM